MPNLRLPAEWEKHKAVLLAWPCSQVLWPDCHERALNELAELICQIKQFSKVELICRQEYQKEAQKFIGDINNITFHDIPNDDIWMRDCGPIIVKDQFNNNIFSNWEFNAWGGKYLDWQLDNAIPKKLAHSTRQRVLEIPHILEGGAIESNGAGCLITTEAVLLNANRNPELRKSDYQKLFQQYFGAEQIIWLKEGLIGDDTDGHIDNITRFVSEKTVVTCTAPKSNANHQRLQENLEILQNFRFNDGSTLEIIELPLPSIKGTNGENLPASYANFLITNEALLIPSYQVPEDQYAKKILADIFPKKEIKSIICRTLLQEGGAIHCLTQPIPL